MMKTLISKTGWILLLTALFCACFIPLEDMPAVRTAAYAEMVPETPDEDPPANEADGSKIESVTIRWTTTDTDGIEENLLLSTTQTGKLRMEYLLSIQLSGMHDYAPGDVTITIPSKVWHGRKMITGENGELVGTVDPGKLLGTVQLPLPAAPSTRADFNWQIINDEYVLTNTRTLDAASIASFEIAITNIHPLDIPDMSISDPISVHCEVITNKGNLIEMTSNELTAQIDTCALMDVINKQGTVYEERPVILPDNLLANLPAGTSEDDYIYVRWNTYATGKGSQPFSLDMVDIPAKPYKMVGGKREYIEGADPIFLGSTNYGYTAGAEEGTYLFNDVAPFGSPGNKNTNTVFMWTAYPKAAFYVPMYNEPQIKYFLDNEAVWTMTECDKAVEGDERTVVTRSAKASVTYSPIRWARPLGVFKVRKWTENVGNHDYTYGYALNRLQADQGADINFIIRTEGSGYAYTHGEIIGEESQKDFGLLGWKQVTQDSATYFHYENTPITSRDYQYKSLRIGVPSKRGYGKTTNGSYGYLTNSTLPNPDLLIEYEIGGTWKKAASVQWGTDGRGTFQFVDVDEDITANASVKTIYFPENVTGIRTSFTSNVFGGKTAQRSDIAQIVWDVYPVMTIKPSAEVKAIVDELFDNSDTPLTRVKNDVFMDVYGYVQPDGAGEHLLYDDDASRAGFSGANYSVHVEKTVKYNPENVEDGGDNDVENRRVKLHYTAKLFEQSNLTVRSDYDAAIAAGIIPRETSGVWYDLLPEGVVPLLDSIRLRSRDTIRNVYTVPDYKGTGRVLMVVEANMKPQVQKAAAGFVDIPQLTFDAYYTWENIEDLGSELDNYIAFESTTPGLANDTLGTIVGGQGEPDDPRGGNNAKTPVMPDDIAQAMTGLNAASTGNHFAYGHANTTIDVVTYAVSGISKLVMNDFEGIWTLGIAGQEQVTVYENSPYTYRLRVRSSADTTTGNIILYDSIEDCSLAKTGEREDAVKAADRADRDSKIGWPGTWQDKGQWRGVLQSVDASEFVEAGVSPVIYYAVVPLAFGSNTSAYDLTNGVWQRAQADAHGIWTVPEGLEVRAVAIDARKRTDGRDFVLAPENTLIAYLNMRAPQDDAALGAYARIMDETGAPTQEIDWDAALQVQNNMYAYNDTHLICVHGDANGNMLSATKYLHHEYTRVGILPGVLSVKKTWKDQNNHDNLRPEEVTVALMRKVQGSADTEQAATDKNGDPITAVLSEQNNWSYMFEQIAVINEEGKRYLYSVQEEPVPGYTSSAVRVDENHFVITNTHPNEQIEIKGEKLWNDEENALGLRPLQIYVTLYCDGKYVKEITVSENSEGRWTYSFGEFEKYKDGGEPHTYTVTEEYVPKYVPSSEDYRLLVNDYAPYGDLEIYKHLKDATPAAAENAFEFTVVLLEEQTDLSVEPLPLDGSYRYAVFEQQADEWQQVSEGEIRCGGSIFLKGGQKGVIYDLPSESTYQIEEKEREGFTLSAVEGDEGEIRAGYTGKAEFTNTYAAAGALQLSAKKSLTGHKMNKYQFDFELEDMTPDSETFGQVIRTARVGNPTNTQQAVGRPITASAEAWFGQIEYTHLDDGKTFTYVMREVDKGKPGYTYDDREYTITVTVRDKGDGTLDISTNGFAFGQFSNTYKADGELTLKVYKDLKGRKLEADEFSFELFACNEATGEPIGKAIATAKNDAEGNVTFPAIRFDQDDVSIDDKNPAKYAYLVREMIGSDPTIVYSKEAYVMTVKVYDNHDGTLSFVQENQVGEREVNLGGACEKCYGSGLIVKEDYSGFLYIVSPAGPMAGKSEAGWQSHPTATTFCQSCNGYGTLDDISCSACMNTGLRVGGVFYSPYYSPDEYTITGYKYISSIRRYHATTQHESGSASLSARVSPYFMSKLMDCPECGGTGGAEGPLKVTGEAKVPVFTNTLNPGSLTIQKTVAGENPHPDQQFTFMVKLTGEEVSLKDILGESVASGNNGLTNNGEVYHMPDSVKQNSVPYAVLEHTTGKLVFFRVDKAVYDSIQNGDESNKLYDKVNDRYFVKTVADRSQQDGYTYYRLVEGDYPARPEFTEAKYVSMVDPFQLPRDWYGMFKDCTSLISADLQLMDTSKVTSFANMFNGCTNLEKVNVSSFDTSKATNFVSMFYRCNKLRRLDIRNFVFNGADISTFFKKTDVGYLTEIVFGDAFNGFGRQSNAFYEQDNKPSVYKMTLSANPNFYQSSALPDLVTDSIYTGNWVNVDTGDTATSAQLRQWGDADRSGTWQWEAKENFTVSFNPGEGGGAAKSIVLPALNSAYSVEMAPEGLYRHGYRISGFTDQHGNTYSANEDGSFIFHPDRIYGKGDQVTLTAQWEKSETTRILSDDMFTLKLYAGAEKTYENIPAGTAYEVWEDTPSGWVLVSKTGDSGVIQPITEHKAVFTNNYDPDSAKIYLRASKTLDGAAPGNAVFEFELKKDGTQIQRRMSNNDAGAVTFDAIIYGLSEVGTHTYTISEVQPTSNTIYTHDPSVYTATVTVGDDGKGNLSASVIYTDENGKVLDGAPVFRNTTKPGSLQISKRTVDMTEAAKAKNPKFDFVIAFTDRYDQPWSGKISTNVHGSVTVGEDGLYTCQISPNSSVFVSNIPHGVRYVVRETGTLPGWTMDPNTYTGTIEPNVQQVVTLTNHYKQGSEFSFAFSKELIGRSLRDGEFTFATGDEEQNVYTACNDANGLVRFDNLKVTDPKARFWLEELPGNDTTVEHDTSRYWIRLDDNGEGEYIPVFLNSNLEELEEPPTFVNIIKPGYLTVNKTVTSPLAEHAQKEFAFTLHVTDELGQPLEGYPLTFSLRDGESRTFELPHGANYAVTEAAADGFVQHSSGASGTIKATETDYASFTNTYHAKGTYVFEADKTLTGMQLTAGQFSFILMDQDGYEIAKGVNDENGKVRFPPLTFTDADVGQHTYMIAERNLGEGGYTYDDREYTVTLTVADNGDGTMSVETDTPEIVFVNHYSVKTSLQVVKIWEDNENALGIRPESIVVNLYRNNELFLPGVTIRPGADGTWAYTFEDLEALDENGLSYNYEVREQAVNGYTSARSVDGNTTTITNTVLGQLELSKKIQGGNRKKVFLFNVTLSRQGEALSGTFPVLHTNASGETKTLFMTTDASGMMSVGLRHGETAVITELPIGTKYTVAEIPDEEYASSLVGGSDSGVIERGKLHKVAYLNKYIQGDFETVDITVRKVWDDDGAESRPSSVVVVLGREEEPEFSRTRVLSSENDWKTTFYGIHAGYTYYVKELNVDGSYYAEISRYGDVFTVTNHYLPKTGDEDHPAMWLGMLAVSGTVLAMLTRKKKNKPSSGQ